MKLSEDGASALLTNRSGCLDRNEKGDWLPVYNDFLSFNWLENRLKVGGSAPYGFLTLANFEVEGEEKELNLELKYYGQLGENKWLPVDYNGLSLEMVDNNPNHIIIKAHNDNLSVSPKRGEINVVADYDLKYPTLPVLTGMQCRTDDGIVNDTFEQAQEGNLLFTAGAFSQLDLGYDEWGYPLFTMEYSEADIKVEYSAHGTDNFETLEAEPLTTEPQLPGIGQLYTYNLGQVDQTSSDGWFDARITLTAPGGNVQTQTISPLFCIKSTTALSPIDANTDSETEYFNLQGIRVENPSSGLYMVKRGNTVTKQFIH